MSTPEETLVAGLKSKNRHAQEAFWRQFYEPTYAICAAILGRGPDAADTAVDLMADFMFNYVEKLSSPQALWAYLHLMAVRRSLRLRGKLRKNDPIEPETTGDLTSPGPEHQAELRLLMPRMASCLAELSPKAQQVIRMCYGQQLTQEDIGALVGGSKQYIGRLLNKSIGLLKACLEAGVKNTDMQLNGGEVR
jgi:RNA polymerase sigma factor (sigma-70 family)